MSWSCKLTEAMTHISPELFYGSFEGVAREYEPKLVKCWDSKPQYTKLVRDEFLPALAKGLHLCCYSHKDYYWLDAIFYAKADTTHFPAGTYAEYISVALEHECESGGTVTEMNKLQLFNCPLKVLVTYPKPRGKDQATLLLEQYADIVTRADVFNDISTLRRQLVIFGWPGPKWEAHVYRGGSFERLRV